MANFRLDLNGDFTSEILSLYLWGQKRAPSKDEIASNKWIGRKEESVTAIVSGEQFVNKAGDFVNAKDFKLFDVFFSGKMKNGKKLNINNIESKVEINNEEIILNHDQFVELFYKGTSKEKDAKDAISSVSLYNRNIYGENFAKLAFMFGTITVGLDTENIRYVLDKDLKPIRVDNVSYIVKDEWKDEKGNIEKENFDFDGGEGSSTINVILKQVADPSNIGKKVIIKFDGAPTVRAGTINGKDFESPSVVDKKYLDNAIIPPYMDETTKIGYETYKYSDEIMEYIKKIGMTPRNFYKFYEEFKRIRGTGVIDFRAKDDKLVIFGTDNNDTLKGTKAKNFDFINIKPFLNHYEQYIKNGIVYVGGDGADDILGTKYNDILYASDSSLYDDNSNNILNGDDGEDILYGSNGDDILIGNQKTRTIHYPGAAGTYLADGEREKDILIGGNGFDTYYVGDKDEIIDSDEKGQVNFDGTILVGGVFDEKENAYFSTDKKIKYELNKDTLIVSKDNHKITIKNYNKYNKSLGINLAKELGKEVAIVLDLTGSMSDDIETCKVNAESIARNIFKVKYKYRDRNANNNNTDSNSDVFSKISIVTFNNNDIKTIGTYTTYESFKRAIDGVEEQGGSREYIMAALLEGMNNFSKNNGLSKERYI